MAMEDSTQSEKLNYDHCDWGEAIRGTRTELQGLGIGVGLAFPGEEGGPKRKLNVIDPRGFKTSIAKNYHGGYTALIEFPGRGRDSSVALENFAPGITKRGEGCYDFFVGTANALVDSGLILPGQLPGQPGMRKTSVVVFADGSLPQGSPHNPSVHADQPGDKTITRKTKSTYQVRVRVSTAVRDGRLAIEHLARAQYSKRMRALARPVSLLAYERWTMPALVFAKSERGAKPKLPNHLRLVWSASCPSA